MNTMNTMNLMTFDQAAAKLAERQAIQIEQYGQGTAIAPSRSLSTYDPRNKRWSLRNVRGFMCFVSATTGKCWSFKDASEATC